MTIPWRFVVASVLVWFSWQGATLPLNWPPTAVEVVTPPPSDEAREWVADVKVADILPKDRIYLAGFYSAIGYVMARDEDLDPQIVTTNEKFSHLHAGSLRFAIDRKEVGKYPGLGAAIDEVFAEAAGEDVAPMTDDMRERIIDACDALAWKFEINGEDGDE